MRVNAAVSCQLLEAPVSGNWPTRRYTLGTTRRAVITMLVSFVWSGSAVAQVKIIVPEQRYKAEEQIRAAVENSGTHPITICVEFGQTSPKGTDIESTPIPFYVQSHDGARWGTPLLIGPDIGSIRRAVEVEGGKRLEFPFRLKQIGELRLRLEYWVGSKPDLRCTGTSKGAKLATSASFTVQ